MGLSAFVAQQAFLPPNPIESCKGKEDIVWLTNLYDQETPALYVRHKRPLRKYTLLFSHGNAEDIVQNRTWMYELSEYLSCDVLAYEYTGYADTKFSYQPSELFCYSNADAAYKYLTENLAIPPENIIIFGRSLGTGVAVDLASRKESGGLILQSPLLSAVRVVTETHVTMPFDIFASVDKIHRVNVPVFIIHGLVDEVVPAAHGERLYKLVKGKKDYLFLPDAGHNDILLLYNDKYLSAIGNFLDNLQQ